MGLFILCRCIYEAEKILFEAIFTIILSKFDGPILSVALILLSIHHVLTKRNYSQNLFQTITQFGICRKIR